MPQCWLTEDIRPAEEGLFSNMKKRREEKAARKAQFDEYKANIEKRTTEILSSNPTVESLAKELAGIFIKADAEKHDDTYSAKILRGSVGKKDITDDMSGYIAEWKQEHGTANIKVCQVKDLYYGVISSSDGAFMVIYPFDGDPVYYSSLKELAHEIAMYTVTKAARECWLTEELIRAEEGVALNFATDMAALALISSMVYGIGRAGGWISKKIGDRIRANCRNNTLTSSPPPPKPKTPVEQAWADYENSMKSTVESIKPIPAGQFATKSLVIKDIKKSLPGMIKLSRNAKLTKVCELISEDISRAIDAGDNYIPLIADRKITSTELLNSLKFVNYDTIDDYIVMVDDIGTNDEWMAACDTQSLAVWMIDHRIVIGEMLYRKYAAYINEPTYGEGDEGCIYLEFKTEAFITGGLESSGCWLTDELAPAEETFSAPKFKKGGFIDKYTNKAAANIAKSANKAAKKKYGDDFEKRINARIKEILNSGKSNEAICQESLKLMVGSKRYMHGDLGKQMAEANCARMKKKCKVAKVCNAANLYYVYVETQDSESAVYIPFAGGKDMERMAMRRVANEIARYEIMKNKGTKVMESFHDKVFNEGEEEPKDQSAVCGDINTVGPLIDQYVSYIKELYFTIENGHMVSHIATPAEAKVNIESYCSYPKKDPNVSTPLMKSGTYPYTCKIEHGIVTHVVIPVPAKDFPMGVKCLPLNQVIDDLKNTIGIDQKYDVITRKRALCQVMSIFKDLLEREKYAPLKAYASDELKFENMGRVDQKDPEGWSKFLMGYHEADMGGFDFTAAKDKAQSLMDLMNMHFYPEARKAYAKSSSGDKFVLHMHSEDFKCCFDLATMEYYQEGVAPYDHFEEEFGSAQESLYNQLFGDSKNDEPAVESTDNSWASILTTGAIFGGAMLAGTGIRYIKNKITRKKEPKKPGADVTTKSSSEYVYPPEVHVPKEEFERVNKLGFKILSNAIKRPEFKELREVSYVYKWNCSHEDDYEWEFCGLSHNFYAPQQDRGEPMPEDYVAYEQVLFIQLDKFLEYVCDIAKKTKGLENYTFDWDGDKWEGAVSMQHKEIVDFYKKLYG